MHWLSKKSTKIIMIMPAVILFTVFFWHLFLSVSIIALQISPELEQQNLSGLKIIRYC